MPLRPACSFARRAVLGRCLSPPSLRPRAPGVGLALGAGRPWCVPPPPHRRVRYAPLGGWGLPPPPPPRPGVLWLALRVPKRRSGVGARLAAGGHIAGTHGCPWCPRAQQHRTPLCVSAHALHGRCPCASHTHVFHRRLCVSGLCCRVRACCGVKRMVCGSWLPFSGPVSST